jgi:hypothetical protein
MLQLVLLRCLHVWCLEVHLLVIVLKYVRVGCKYYVVIIIISIIIMVLMRYNRRVLCLLYRCLRWVLHLLWHVLDMLWYTWGVSPVPPVLLVSVRMLVVLLFSHPLLSPGMLWRHPRRWGALEVFWASSKKRVQFVQQLFRGLKHLQHHVSWWEVFPRHNKQISLVCDLRLIFVCLVVDQCFVGFTQRWQVGVSSNIWAFLF